MAEIKFGKPQCRHTAKHGYYCERIKGHEGYHMLPRGSYPSASYETWDDDGDEVDPGVRGVVFADDPDTWCGHVSDGWLCERVQGHKGLHRLPPGKYETAPYETWTKDGEEW